MSKLQTFVKSDRNGRPESPRQGQPKVNQQRAQHAQAANLKVAMKPEVARPPTALNSHGLYGRGESINQNQSASLQQQHLQPRLFGEGRTHDPYDTDAESIDTTVNHSVVQVENTQVFDQQQLRPENQEDEVESGEDEEGSDEDFFDEEGQWHEELQHYLDQSGYAGASRDEQMQYLQQTQPQIFRTIDGDSYPTTTEGIPTEADEPQEQSIENLGPTSPSPRRLAGQGQAPLSFNQKPHQSHLTPGAQDINLAPQQTSRIYQQGKQIRSQQRHESTVHGRTQSGQQHDNVEPPTSLPPSYSQTTLEQALAASSTAHARPRVLTPGIQSGLPQRSSRMPSVPGDMLNPVPRIVEPGTSAKNVSATRTKVVPIFQQSVEPTPVEPLPVDERSEHVGDYNPEILSQMKYEELRDESFDKAPCQRDSSLPEHMRDKPLEERVQFAHQQLDPTDQAEFFGALPTTEWEEAGDWFLGQFSTIIARTREARQKKRKLAKGFEREIEARHQRVAKKQRLVEGAMAKMQVQGEGLVPKSPRASKSPRPRKERSEDRGGHYGGVSPGNMLLATAWLHFTFRLLQSHVVVANASTCSVPSRISEEGGSILGSLQVSNGRGASLPISAFAKPPQMPSLFAIRYINPVSQLPASLSDLHCASRKPRFVDMQPQTLFTVRLKRGMDSNPPGPST